MQQVNSETIGDESAEVRHWPVQIIMRCELKSHGRWEVDQWSLAGCETDRGTQSTELVFEQQAVSERCADYRWRGLSLELFRDERAAYRFNISSDDPRLFVVCNEDEERMQPFLITACQDTAASYMDGGEEDVFSIAMPPAIQCWIEAFIGRHGEPDMAVGKSKRRHHGKSKSERSVHG